MDDMAKRLLLAMGLSLLVLLAFSHFYKAPAPGVSPQSAQQVERSAPGQPSGGFSETQTGIQEKPVEGEMQAGVSEPVEEIITELQTDKFVVTFSNLGGYIKEFRLKEKTVDQAALLSRAPEPGYGMGALELKGVDSALTTAPHQTEKADKIVLCKRNIAPGLEITKKFDFNYPDNTFSLDIKIENTSGSDRQLKYRLTGATGKSREDYKKEYSSSRDQGYLEINTLIAGQKTRDTYGKLRAGQDQQHPGPVEWTAVKEKYFCLIFKPASPAETAFSFSVKTPRDALSTGIETRVFLLPQSSTVIHNYKLYAGPMDVTELKTFGAEKIIDFGFFGGIGQLLLFVLKFFYKIFHNWGVAIIMLSLVIKVVLHPLTAKSMRSMKEMQALQPHMARIKEEYKDNPQKMNKEMMELYRKHKVNPLGGCLPMLLQMPVFIALWQALTRAIELRGAGFLWIKDLSAPDALYRLPFSFEIPLIGKMMGPIDSINLLPILMGLATYLQQKLTPTPGTQASQQRMMSVMMTVMFTLIFYNFPSGLVLYWLVNTVLTAAHQYFIMRKPTTNIA